jgi:hypothetical protein
MAFASLLIIRHLISQAHGQIPEPHHADVDPWLDHSVFGIETLIGPGLLRISKAELISEFDWWKGPVLKHNLKEAHPRWPGKRVMQQHYFCGSVIYAITSFLYASRASFSFP